jgi:hypothetical protein
LEARSAVLHWMRSQDLRTRRARIMAATPDPGLRGRIFSAACVKRIAHLAAQQESVDGISNLAIHHFNYGVCSSMLLESATSCVPLHISAELLRETSRGETHLQYDVRIDF